MFNYKSMKEFIDHIIEYYDVEDILVECKTSSEKCFIFERLFDITLQRKKIT